MYPAPIARYERPATIAEALEAMAGAGEGALYLAGGTAAMPAVNARALRPCALVDLGGVEELDGIAKGPRGVAIRPMTRLRNLAGVSALHGAHQAITDAAATMGDRQVRNAGTIGGGLFWKGGAACMATAALCLDAVLALRSPGGAERALPASAFVAHPVGADGGGRELLVEIRLPRAEPGAASAYKKAATGAGGPPLAGVAASIKVDAEGLCSGARLAVWRPRRGSSRTRRRCSAAASSTRPGRARPQRRRRMRWRLRPAARPIAATDRRSSAASGVR